MSKANPLAAYVESFILNPTAELRPNLEEISEETAAVVSDRVEGEESAKAIPTSLSKLRLQNLESLEDRDPRYRGKKVSRITLQKTDTPLYDPELAKLCIITEQNDKYSDDAVSDDLKSEKERLLNKKNKYDEQSTDDSMELGEDEDSNNEVDDEDDDYNDDESEIDENKHQDDDEGSVSDDVKDSGVEEEPQSSIPIKTFNTESNQRIQKGLAVKNQCSIFDNLFEARISLQKVASIANQLPQHDMFKEFARNVNYPLYATSLHIARKSVKKLIGLIIELQETLLSNNPENERVLQHICAPEENRNEVQSDDESSQALGKRGKKRNIEKYEEVFNKRHKALLPYRDEIITKWFEKTRLMVNQGRNKFSKFEVPPVQQFRNIMMNKDQLIKRTQLYGLSRGNVYKILGKVNKEQSVSVEEHDPEIFDDSDFYSRMLEAVVKSKMTLSDDMAEMSQQWVGIQKLRQKTKKSVGKQLNKDKKLRFEVMSKLEQFLAPCKPALMTDTATNKLFSSLFGK